MTETNRIEFKRELTREMVESLGSGMNRIMSKYSRDNFEFGGNYVRMIVPYNWIPKEGEVENEESQKSSHETEVDEKVNERQRLIISVITKNPYITQSELAKILEISLVYVNKNMKKLQEKGLIRRIGPTKEDIGRWLIMNNEQLTMKTKWVHKKLGDCLTIGNGCDYKHLQPGDVPVYGTGGVMTYVDNYLYDGETVCIGRKGTINHPIYHNGKIWTVDTLFYTHSFVEVIPKFIYYAFCNIDWNKYNEATGVPSLSKETIYNIEISVPDLSVQRRIAAILSSADKVIDSTRRLIEKYKKMKQGMMEDLLKPKESWKKYEYKDVIIENRLGGNYENSTANIGYPVIKMGNIMRGYISLEKMQYLSFEKKYIADDVLKKGDLLFNTRNTLDLVGKVSIWNNELPFALYNSNLLRMKFDENIIGSNEFMNYYFNYHKTLMELRGFAIGTTSVAAIYGRDLDRLSIIVPSIKEQRRIAAILSGIDAKIAAEEKVLEKYEKVKKGLMEKLLNE